MIEAPPRSLEQRHQALRLANRVRTHRAYVRNQIAKSHLLGLEALTNPWPFIETLKVSELVKWLPGIGAIKSDAWLRKAGINGCKTLAGLTDRQREDLAEIVRVHFEPDPDARRRDRNGQKRWHDEHKQAS